MYNPFKPEKSAAAPAGPITLATVGTVSEEGVTLILPGATEPTQAHYPNFSSSSLESGDSVIISRVSGTLVVMGKAGGGGGGGGGGGTSDYNDLSNKPSINGNTLRGNKTAEQLGLGTYSKPSGGIPQTDLAQTVQNKLDKTVEVSDTQPTETENKLWVDTDAGAGTSYQIPTVAEMEAADAQTAEEIGIVITGKRPSMAVTAGQYVIVRGSTISGVTDGLYTANTALSPSTDVSAANLTAVSGGGLNSLSALLDTAFKNITASVTGTTTAGENAWKYVPVTIPDGYRMFAVNSLRFSGTDATYIVLRGFEIDNSNSRVTLFFKNTTTSTTINYTATVWIACVKSNLF